jgi:arylsulfatase
MDFPSRTRRSRALAASAISVVLLLAGCGNNGASPALEQLRGPPVAQARPNILLIVADDLGYSDLGAFGGEIHTPHLDRLAGEGRLLLDHHSAFTCAPTRAMIHSGTDQHVTGIGSQSIRDYQRGKPGYEGYLNERSLYLAELLKDGGYHTYIAGKWHLGSEEDQAPSARGYEQSWVLLPGVANHFASRADAPLPDNYGPFRENGKLVTPPANYYSTDFFTDKLIEYIGANAGDGKPFFAFAAYTSPHWPLQAPQNFIERYKGRYDAGYDAIKAARIARQKQLGIIPQEFVPAPSLPASETYPSWEQLTPEQRKFEARKMEVYAAMVTNLDHNIGRLIAYLKQKGLYENTLIVFQSDNGPEANRGNLNNGYDNSLANLGRYGSYVYVGPRWAEVSAAPFRLWKSYPTEAGHSVPTIVRLPGQQRPESALRALTGIQDLLPTFLEVAGVANPGSQYKGQPKNPITGFSLLPLLDGRVARVRGPGDVLANEQSNRRYVRKDNWKITYFDGPLGKGDWELFDLATDRSERLDLSTIYPDKRRELIADWDKYVAQFGVVLPPPPAPAP